MSNTCKKLLLIGSVIFLCAVGFAALVVETPPRQASFVEAHEPRSGHWPKVRADHLKVHPLCEVCGSKKDIQVHHVLAFHKHPELELDSSNLITLCRQHHLLFGHLDNYESWNVRVREDAALWKRKIENRPK